MRILILASLPVSLRNFRGPLIETFCAQGHSVHCAAPGLTAEPDTQDWLTARGVQCHDLPLTRTGTSALGDLRALAALYRLMRLSKPDLVLAYTIKPVIWGLIGAWLARIPERVALITGLGYAFTGPAKGKRAAIRWLVSRLYKLALSHATLVFFQNPDDRDDFRRWGILRADARIVLVNGSGVDTDRFAPADLPPTPIRFLLIARMLKDKGIREYVAAAEQLRKTCPEAQFHLIGPHDSSPDAIPESDLRAWQRAGHVIWHGPLADVRRALAACHVYVLPSYREGTPRSVLEAMAMGRAIVTTDAPGCRETVQPGVNGFLVPPRDPAALAGALAVFLRDPDLAARMGKQSRRLAVEKYDIHEVNAVMLSAMGLADAAEMQETAIPDRAGQGTGPAPPIRLRRSAI